MSKKIKIQTPQSVSKSYKSKKVKKRNETKHINDSKSIKSTIQNTKKKKKKSHAMIQSTLISIK